MAGQWPSTASATGRLVVGGQASVRVFQEAFRILVSGGRMAVGDGHDGDALQLAVAIKDALQRIGDDDGLLLRHQRVGQTEIVRCLAAIIDLAVAAG
jgi:hypothetical protein